MNITPAAITFPPLPYRHAVQATSRPQGGRADGGSNRRHRPASTRWFAHGRVGYGSGIADNKEASMATTIRDVMTTNPIVYPATATVAEAAEGMREFDIGDVLVERDGKISGIVTDRDIVVRAVADGKPAGTVT